MLGTVGGDERLSCTVIGDSVNLGARLEGMTKAFGASIIMSEATRAALSQPRRVEARSIGRVAAKGKERAVGVHEVLDGLAPEERARKLATRAELKAAIEAFAAGDLDAASAAFRACAERDPSDRAATLYVELCAKADGPVSAGWDGAVRLDAK